MQIEEADSSFSLKHELQQEDYNDTGDYCRNDGDKLA